MPIPDLAAAAAGSSLALLGRNIITVTSAVDATSGSNGTTQYPAYVKGIATGLTAAALVLIAGAYYLVIGHATPLGNYCKLPSTVIQANLKVLLEEEWPAAAVAEAPPSGEVP